MQLEAVDLDHCRPGAGGDTAAADVEHGPPAAAILDAALGTRLTVPTLDGGTVTLKIPEGTPSGKVFRVKGRGIDAKKGQGDLLVTVQVAVPTDLTDEQRAAVEALAATMPEAPRPHLGV